MNYFVSKFTIPTKLDKMSKGTLWENKVDDNESIYYVQTGDYDDPHWDRVGIYAEKKIHNFFMKKISKQELRDIFMDLIKYLTLVTD